MPALIARMMASSSISIAAGVIPAAIAAETTREASTTEGNAASTVFTASGACVRRTVIAVTSAKVPSEPTAMPVRS